MGEPKQSLDGAVAWAAGELGAAVERVRPLTGGLSAGMAGLDTSAGRFALRWWEEPGPWPTISLARQRAVLSAVGGAALPAPRVAASDPARPASLTTWLPGEIDLDPTDPNCWLSALAKTLAAIHQVPVPADLPVADAAADPKTDHDLEWLADHGLAAEARAVSALPVTGPPVLLHGDYQHFNVLWEDGRLSGVIDWVLGGRGDRGLDVGHCRLNLAVLYGVEPAMTFLDRYEEAAGQRVSPAADLAELLAFSDAWLDFIPRQVAGRRPVDVPGMAGRVRATLIETLRRLH